MTKNSFVAEITFNAKSPMNFHYLVISKSNFGEPSFRLMF